MSSWGTTDVPASKPKYLTDAEKLNCGASEAGWTVPAGGNSNPAADREVLVAIGGLGTSLGVAEIKSVNYGFTTYSAAAGGTLSVSINFNENVVVTGTPQVELNNSVNANHTLSYASGTGSNRLTFSLVVDAGDVGILSGDVLSIEAGSVALNGGTIVGVDTGATDLTLVVPGTSVTAVA
mgnify:FL=1